MRYYVAVASLVGLALAGSSVAQALNGTLRLDPSVLQGDLKSITDSGQGLEGLKSLAEAYRSPWKLRPMSPSILSLYETKGLKADGLLATLAKEDRRKAVRGIDKVIYGLDPLGDSRIEIDSFLAGGIPSEFGASGFLAEGGLPVALIGLVAPGSGPYGSSIDPVHGKAKHQLHGFRYGEAWGLCSSEEFYFQPTVGHCTGFLSTRDTLLTAYHCLDRSRPLGDHRVVFDYRVDVQKREVPLQIDARNVFEVRSVVRKNRQEDWIELRLDRPVPGRTPFPRRTAGQVKVDQEVWMIGHPMGLPLKVASGARVRRVDSSKRFVANLDAYRANSGSPVLSWDEDLGLRVEGILVSGERDFKLAETGEGCQISRVCPDEECLGETVVNIAAVR